MRSLHVLVVSTLLAVGIAGCLGGSPIDAGEPTFEGEQDPRYPSFRLPDEISGLSPVDRVELPSASGLWIDDGIAYVGGLGSGLHTVDVRDPGNATALGHVPGISARDVDLLQLDDRTVAVTAGEGDNMTFVDVTDPTSPKLLSILNVSASVHNVAVVPGTGLVYNSQSLGPVDAAGIDVVDASDPTDPKVVNRWTFPATAAGQPVRSTGCHDVTVYPDADRAYCAGVTQTYVMDIADPEQPSIVGVITNPLINIHHFAVPARNHSLLLVGDEYGGALLAACFGYEETPAGPASPPTGALWTYDISDPSNPTVQGYVSPPMPSEGPVTPRVGIPFNTCTAHFGQQIADRDVFAMGWYRAGVLLIDFSDPSTPRIVDQVLEERNVWDARYWNGHIVTGNIGDGASVLRVT